MGTLIDWVTQPAAAKKFLTFVKSTAVGHDMSPMRLLRLTTVATAVVLALVAPLTTAAITAPAQASATPVLFGLHTHSDAGRLATQRALHKRSALIGYFAGWDRGMPSAAYLNRWTTNRGGVPVIATGPAGYAPLARLISGAEDAQIAAWAEGTKAFGRPVMIRLMAEMNGSWEPWSTGKNGNKPGEYVAAWRHVVDVFRAHGATNAIWVWNPDRSFHGATPMASLWPGADYVDWIGLDVYNFGTATKGGWLSFASMMKPSVREIRRVAGSTKPLMINEVGCAAGSRKARWVTAMYASLPSYGVKAVLWFDYDMKADWRLTADPTVRAAARTAVSRPRIGGAGQVPLSTIERVVTTGG